MGSVAGVEAADIRRARTLVFQAEDALDLVVMALEGAILKGVPLTGRQRSELRADVTTVQAKAASLAATLTERPAGGCEAQEAAADRSGAGDERR